MLRVSSQCKPRRLFFASLAEPGDPLQRSDPGRSGVTQEGAVLQLRLEVGGRQGGRERRGKKGV